MDGRKELNVGLCIEVLLEAEWMIKILTCNLLKFSLGLSGCTVSCQEEKENVRYETATSSGLRNRKSRGGL